MAEYVSNTRTSHLLRDAGRTSYCSIPSWRIVDWIRERWPSQPVCARCAREFMRRRQR